MNWHSRRFLGLLAIICFILVAVAASISFYQINIFHNKRAIIPPEADRTTYTNTTSTYTVNYPTAWHLDESADKLQIRIFLANDKAAPEAVAFDIDCFANPNQLDAQTFWQQTKASKSNETGVGLTSFSSGASAYVAKGQGQTNYTVYTLVQQKSACQIVSYGSDSANAKIINDVVNSFKWR